MKFGAAALCLCLLLVAAATADSLNVRLVGQYQSSFPGSGVAVEGDYAYIVAEDLYVISVADPRSPFEVGTVSLGGARNVAVAGDFAYVADTDSSMRVISIVDPAHPVEVGSCSTPDVAINVAVRGQYAYVATSSGFCVVSVADPTHPVQVGYLPGDFEYNLDVSDNYAYVADHLHRGGLRIISVADPTHPTETAFFSCPVQSVAVSAGLAYIGCNDSSFRVISVSDPANPVEVGRIDSIPWANGTQDVCLARGYAFVTTWSDGLHIVSIADSTRPAEVAAYYRLASCWSMAYQGRYIYVTASDGLYIFRFYQLGDIDIDPDSLNVSAGTLELRKWATNPGDSIEHASGEFVFGNTSVSYNPDTTDGPSVSPVDSVSFTCTLTGPGGSIDSISIPNLPHSVAQGQTAVCTLSARIPVGFRDGDYSGTIVVSGKDTAGLLVQDSCNVRLRKLGDIDVDTDSLDVVADTIRVRPRLVSSGPPPTYSGYAYGEFILVNATESYNPDTTDGPSRSPVRSLRFSGSLSGPHGTLDSVLISNLPESLEIGQAVICTLAVYVPPGLPAGDYSGPIVIRSDSLQPQIAETVYALVRKLGDLDVDDDSLDVARDTMNLNTQPAGPVYHRYAKAEFMLVNTSSSYNPDTADGPSQSPLQGIKVEAKVEAVDSSTADVRILNLPSQLALGQTVECTLALTLPAHVTASGYGGWVVINALDTAGYDVADSFYVVVQGPQARQNLDSLRVAPIPFKPNQNPEHDAIHFQGLSSGAKVVVYDASGQSVWSATETGDGHLKWDAKVASGIYVYLVVSADGKSSKVGKLSVIR